MLWLSSDRSLLLLPRRTTGNYSKSCLILHNNESRQSEMTNNVENYCDSAR